MPDSKPQPRDLLMEPAAQVLHKEFTVTLAEAIESQRLLAQQRMNPKFPYLLAMVAWFFTSAVSFVQNGEMDHRVLVALLMNCPVPLVIMGLLKGLPRLAWRSHFTTHFGPGPYLNSVSIGETRIIVQFGEIEYRLPWHAVRTVANQAGELRIYVAKFALVRIPDRVFDTEIEKRQWMEVIENKTGLAFS